MNQYVHVSVPAETFTVRIVNGKPVRSANPDYVGVTLNLGRNAAKRAARAARKAR